MSRTRLSVATVLAVLVLALGACATAPPGNVVGATEAKAFVGKWQGSVRNSQGTNVPVTLSITETGKDTGIYEGVAAGQAITGKFRVKDGKAETESGDGRGRKGTWTLYEQEGKQVLSTYSEPGNRGNLTRIP